MEKQVIEISWASLWKILFFLMFVAVIFFSRQILLGLFLAIVISSGLDFMVDALERWGVPRTLSVILIFLVGTLLAIIIAYQVIPTIIIDLNSILSSISKTAASKWLGPILSLKNQSFSLFVSRISTQLFSGNVSPLSTLSDLVGGFGLAISVLVSSFYLSLSRDGVERFIRAVLPENTEDTAIRIYHRSRKKIGLWFRNQIFLSFMMGASTWIALTLLGVQHAFLVAILAGLFELMPFVGPILSGAAAVLAAFATAPALAFYTLIIFLLIHQLEANVLVPLLTSRYVGLHPVIVIVSLLIGIELGGVLGAIIAVPAAAVFQEVVEDWGSKKKGRNAFA